ncbi:hypothetical protein [Flavobacterium sp.]|uniref:hypothetical protein n=1 Tax=Flavobacterium sp. TaxID=239 RepID=UPI00404834ED
MEKHVDKVILKNVINALGVKTSEFRQKLNYSSNTTIYNVFNEVHGISSDMISRIIKAYPEINEMYLKRGIGNPLKTTQSTLDSFNLHEDLTVNELLKLPKRIEMLEELVDKLQNQINILINEKK